MQAEEADAKLSEDQERDQERILLGGFLSNTGSETFKTTRTKPRFSELHWHHPQRCMTFKTWSCNQKGHSV